MKGQNMTKEVDIDKALSEAKAELRKNGVVINEKGLTAFLKDKVKICMIPDNPKTSNKEVKSCRYSKVIAKKKQ